MADWKTELSQVMEIKKAEYEREIKQKQAYKAKVTEFLGTARKVFKELIEELKKYSKEARVQDLSGMMDKHPQIYIEVKSKEQLFRYYIETKLEPSSCWRDGYQLGTQGKVEWSHSDNDATWYSMRDTYNMSEDAIGKGFTAKYSEFSK